MPTQLTTFSHWARSLFLPLAPVVFVFLWSTGFISAKAGLVYAEPFTFLLLRWIIAAALLFLLCKLTRATWPSNLAQWGHCAIVGLLVHGVYLGGVFSAINLGVDAGLTSLIVGLQPLLTVLIAAIWLAESLNRYKIGGVLLGLVGICLVLFKGSLHFSDLSPMGLGYSFAGLLGIVIGTLYQKRFCRQIELLPATAIQFVAASALVAPAAIFTESMQINWTPEFAFVLAWLVIVLSMGAVMLLWWLIRHVDAGQVTSYFYLVPPVVAVQAWVLFDEQLTAMTLVGMALCVLGVWMVQIKKAQTAPP